MTSTMAVIQRLVAAGYFAASFLGTSFAAGSSDLPQDITASYSISGTWGESTMSGFDCDSILSLVQSELRIARRLLQEFGNNIAVGFDSYIERLESALDAHDRATKGRAVSVADFERLGFALRWIRTAFEEGLSSRSAWMRLAKTVNPEQQTYKIPRRFVTLRLVSPEPAFVPNSRRASVKQLLREFDSSNVDSSGATA